MYNCEKLSNVLKINLMNIMRFFFSLREHLNMSSVSLKSNEKPIWKNTELSEVELRICDLFSKRALHNAKFKL